MICDVCGHGMRLVPTAEPDVKTLWICAWCHAWTVLGHLPHEVSRPQYAPVNLRWERADSTGLPTGVLHAYGHFGTTLCGLRDEGLSASPYPWVPEWDSACPGCRSAAAEIDGRWPVEKRDGNREWAPPPPGSHWPPF
ncbi:hypothetical protein AB0F07_30270 [Streptomyces fructofermentans]|uniref:hypothetical protein n=1 Tax=Streptomyces fructofermentans TaxID=152141 RepID=UPI0033CCF29C